MRDALILGPVSIVVLVLIRGLDNLMLGASGDLVVRYLPLYFAAWLGAWLAGSLSFRLPFVPKDFSHFYRCIVIVLIFWPMHGLASALAEQWTIHHRMASWKEPSDLGYTYMYWEMSGMGYARGWADWGRKVWSHSIGGLFASVVWFPALLVSCLFWRWIFRWKMSRHQVSPVAK